MCICGAGYVHLSAGASEDLRCQIPRNGAKYDCDALHMGASNPNWSPPKEQCILLTTEPSV